MIPTALQAVQKRRGYRSLRGRFPNQQAQDNRCVESHVHPLILRRPAAMLVLIAVME